MRPVLTYMCSMMVGVTFFITPAKGISTDSLQWMTNYEEAENLSRATFKPIILFFTGSDWCNWCSKLEQESLDTPEFAQAVGDKFIFMRLDFPVNSTLPTPLAVQNKQLQKKYNIRSFPTLIILDGQQQKQIGITGYRAGGGKMYAAHLSKIVADYFDYQKKLEAINKQKYSGAELKKLYAVAQNFGYESDINQIIKVGVNSEDSHFFMIERYRKMTQEGLSGLAEATALKKELQLMDPNNEKMTHYHLALIDFEGYTEAGDKRSADLAVASLVNYIQKFGPKDKEHLWRLQMIISQIYFDRNNLAEALNFAESSFTSAPPTAKIEISTAIKNIKSQMATETAVVRH
ncbi:thioredoxin family protein [Neochlamydia sp. S13]|uniref:thioredoxin family protein n=1 Tax=Neochlamydia sp. S13 TaxID=1353976 RepID=UPI0005A68423|nr:thioredoxin family protein [Neochlamydia sp. S13]BBI16502.1 Protein disulfide isomerase [Neochlamydia sp. S13]